MSRRSLHRISTAFFVVLSLLFSQLAVVSYVCPQQMAMAEGTPCDGMDTQQAALCHQQAADPGQSFEAVKLPVASLPMLIQVIELPLVRGAGDATSLPAAATVEAQPPPDPLFLSTLRLRV